MILINKILWNNEMTLAIGMISELDREEFEEAALESHLELTGESLVGSDYQIKIDKDIRRLEVDLN